MYFFDPDRGHSRRVKARDQLLAVLRRTTRAAERRARYGAGKLQGRAHGGLSHIRHQLHRAHEEPDDVTLAQKVRSEILGRPPFSDLHLNVDTCQGVVHLRGEVSSGENIEQLTQEVEKVDGVKTVESYLHLPGETALNKRAAVKAGYGGSTP
jgi:hypothetical protein